MAQRRLPRNWPIIPVNGATLEHVIHALAIEQWRHASGGPMPIFQVERSSLLRSAIVQPYQVVGGRAAYPAVLPKAACLFRGLVKNHGLVDGNKRLGVTATGVFLDMNGYRLTARNPELRDFAMKVAGTPGEFVVGRIERWLRRNVRLKTPNDLRENFRSNREIYREITWLFGVDPIRHLVESDGGFDAEPGAQDWASVAFAPDDPSALG